MMSTPRQGLDNASHGARGSPRLASPFAGSIPASSTIRKCYLPPVVLGLPPNLFIAHHNFILAFDRAGAEGTGYPKPQGVISANMTQPQINKKATMPASIAANP